MLKRFFMLLGTIFFKLFNRLEVRGLENYKTDTGVLICANHNSLRDPLLIGVAAPEYMNYMAKKELFKNPILDWFLRLMGGFPVDRNTNDIKAIKTSLKILKDQGQLLIFPEGTRNHGLEPLEAKPGVAMIAIKSKVPVLPVTVDSKYGFFSKVVVTFHEQVHLDEYFGERLKEEDYQRITQEIVNGIYDKMVLRKQ